MAKRGQGKESINELDQLSDRKTEFMNDVVNAINPLTEIQVEKALKAITLAGRLDALPPDKLELIEAFVAKQEVLENEPIPYELTEKGRICGLF